MSADEQVVADDPAAYEQALDRIRQLGKMLWAAGCFRLFVNIDAGIACGKSTLMAQVSRVLQDAGVPLVMVNEPLDEWEATGIFADFYKEIEIIEKAKAEAEAAAASLSPSPPPELASVPGTPDNASVVPGGLPGFKPVPTVAGPVPNEPAATPAGFTGAPANMQMVTYITRTRVTVAGLKQADSMKCFVVVATERSVTSDIVFAENGMAEAYWTHAQMLVYYAHRRSFNEIMRMLGVNIMPDLTAFVDTDVDEAFRRKTGRHRTDETATPGYMKTIDTRYRALYCGPGSKDDLSLLHVDGRLKFNKSRLVTAGIVIAMMLRRLEAVAAAAQATERIESTQEVPAL